MLHPNTVLIGLRGPKRVGKDHTAQIIHNQLFPNKYLFGKLAFAKALKEEVSKALGVPIEELDGPNKEVYRPILQWWGTEFRRNLFGPDYWINRWKEGLRRLELSAFGAAAPAVIVVPDVRFRNEADAVKELGGKVVKIVASGYPLTPDQHPSEVEMDSYTDYDAVLDNTRDRLPHLYEAQVNRLLQSYGLQLRTNL